METHLQRRGWLACVQAAHVGSHQVLQPGSEDQAGVHIPRACCNSDQLVRHQCHDGLAVGAAVHLLHALRCAVRHRQQAQPATGGAPAQPAAVKVRPWLHKDRPHGCTCWSHHPQTSGDARQLTCTLTLSPTHGGPLELRHAHIRCRIVGRSRKCPSARTPTAHLPSGGPPAAGAAAARQVYCRAICSTAAEQTGVPGACSSSKARHVALWKVGSRATSGSWASGSRGPMGRLTRRLGLARRRSRPEHAWGPAMRWNTSCAAAQRTVGSRACLGMPEGKILGHADTQTKPASHASWSQDVWAAAWTAPARVFGGHRWT